jgi:hypothetical protein
VQRFDNRAQTGHQRNQPTRRGERPGRQRRQKGPGRITRHDLERHPGGLPKDAEIQNGTRPKVQRAPRPNPLAAKLEEERAIFFDVNHLADELVAERQRGQNPAGPLVPVKGERELTGPRIDPEEKAERG